MNLQKVLHLLQGLESFRSIINKNPSLSLPFEGIRLRVKQLEYASLGDVKQDVDDMVERERNNPDITQRLRSDLNELSAQVTVLFQGFNSSAMIIKPAKRTSSGEPSKQPTKKRRIRVGMASRAKPKVPEFECALQGRVEVSAREFSSSPFPDLTLPRSAPAGDACRRRRFCASTVAGRGGAHS